MLSNINQTLIFTKRSCLYKILGFAQSYSGPLGDIERFIQLIPSEFKSNGPVNITGINKVNSKCDCFNGSIVNGIREPILYSFGLTSTQAHIINDESENKLFKKIKKSVLTHITFYFEDDDHKPVDFNNETISYTCRIFKI